MPPSPPPSLVSFYDPSLNAPDIHGRTLSSILAWPNSRLESCHDYIQTLFPLPEGSPFNPHAPVTDLPTFTAFRTRPPLRASLLTAFVRILAFYGFTYHATPAPVVRPDPATFPARSRNWLRRFDHNHLRITRVIRCLRVLGLGEEAAAFWKVLREVDEGTGGVVLGRRTLAFWRRAAERGLEWAPEDGEREGPRGEEWLVGA